ALRAAIDFGRADHLASLKQRARIKRAEAPLQQFARLLGALLRGLQAVDDDDQALPVLYRRADQAVAALRRFAGFQAVRADLHVEQRIAVELAHPVPGELLLAEIVIIFRIVADEM